MIKKTTPLYFCAPFGVSDNNIFKKDGVFVGHNYRKTKDRLVLWPEKIGADTINPKNFIEIKNKFKLTEILFVDRTIGTNEVIAIGNHVNRSGENYLRGNTPEGNHPQFPDMSKIYNKHENLKSVSVHTIGQKRFQHPPQEENVIWSELVGLIAPVAHYVGINVSAIGGEDIDKIIRIF